MARNQNCIRIWHWNANGYRCRKALLQQTVRTAAEPPDIIMIQETHMEDPPKLLGYRTHASPPSGRTHGKGAAQGVCTFIRKGITFTPLDSPLGGATSLELCATEIVIGKRDRESLTFVNVYSNPQHRGQRFRTFFHKIKQNVKDAPCIVGGDFNSPHKELGYPRTTAKGRNLLEESDAAGFNLLTDASQPSRLGTSTARDTTPDLVFAHLPDGRSVTWKNTGLNLGSDHYIIEVSLELRGSHVNAPSRKHKLTDWHAFRKQNVRTTIDDIEEWTRDITAAVENASTEIDTSDSIPTMDPHLAHMIEARQSLQRRWKRNRTNRNLRKRIARLGREIEAYSQQLCRQQWHAICKEADGQLHASRTWKLLRHLRDETQSKSFQRHRLGQILHSAIKHRGEQGVRDYLNNKYLPKAAQSTHPGYAGADNPELDADIEESEVRRAIQELNCKSAAGPDRVHNKTLRNLSDEAISALTDYYNRCWRSGYIPKQWRTARTVLIPKPGKPPSIDNLRPISLTSCVGKVMEHILNNRWQAHMEENDKYPPTMIRFRSKLSTQDAMLLIQRDLLDRPSSTDCRAILGLDVKSAFDNVLHSAILAQVTRLGLGKRSYEYIRAFLTDRTAQLHVGHLQLEERRLGSRGTPQGAVISPFLFNLVMIPVADSLADLPHVRHTIYADDVTLWVAGGATGHIQDRLQEAVHRIEGCLQGTGLQCSPQKSELLILPPPGHWRKSAEEEAANIVLRTGDNGIIPHVSSIRVLGMHINAGKGNTLAIDRLITKIGIATRLIKQVATKKQGMRETSLLRLVQSFVISHVAYVGAFHKWLQHEKDKINAAVRKAHRAVLGLLPSTSNEALARLGVHNTLEEIGEAQRIAQLVRLNATKAGRIILQKAGMTAPNEFPTEEDQPNVEKRHIGRLTRHLTIPPLPRNMHPEHDRGRREARAKALARTYEDDAQAYYVDAAMYKNKPHTFALSVIRACDGKCVTAGSVSAHTATQAEEAAIALALTCELDKAITVLSDSRSAIVGYSRGIIGRPAHGLLPTNRMARAHIRWFPAHMETTLGRTPNRNEEADRTARELAHRAVTSPPLLRSEGNDEENEPHPALSFGEVLAWYREQRRQAPKPHSLLSRSEGVFLRQLQTGTALTPALARHICPDLYQSDVCCVCSVVRADLPHIMWGCDEHRVRGYPPELPQHVVQNMNSPTRELQLMVIQQLETALARQKRGRLPDHVNGRTPQRRRLRPDAAPSPDRL